MNDPVQSTSYRDNARPAPPECGCDHCEVWKRVVELQAERRARKVQWSGVAFAGWPLVVALVAALAVGPGDVRDVAIVVIGAYLVVGALGSIVFGVGRAVGQL